MTIFTPFELAGLRRLADSRMGADNHGSTIRVRRRTGRTAQNEDTGRAVPVWLDVHETLPARLGGASRGAAASRTIDRGGVQVEVPTRTLSVPVGTDDLVDGDWVEVIAGENTGLVFTILEVDGADQQSAHRVTVTGEQRPKEWE